MQEEQRNQRLAVVRWAIRMTEGTALAPTLYECQLLWQYVDGTLTIDQVLTLTEEKAN